MKVLDGHRAHLVNTIQWAVGLELLLLINDPWRVFLTTDHPNGACFWRYSPLGGASWGLVYVLYAKSAHGSVNRMTQLMVLAIAGWELVIWNVGVLTVRPAATAMVKLSALPVLSQRRAGSENGSYIAPASPDSRPQAVCADFPLDSQRFSCHRPCEATASAGQSREKWWPSKAGAFGACGRV
jgi:hypothetical protein